MDAASRVQQTQHKAASVVHETRMKAQSVVHETQLQAQRVYDEAQSAVHQARSHASTVEGRASEIIQELNTRHQSELAKGCKSVALPGSGSLSGIGYPDSETHGCSGIPKSGS